MYVGHVDRHILLRLFYKSKALAKIGKLCTDIC